MLSPNHPPVNQTEGWGAVAQLGGEVIKLVDGTVTDIARTVIDTLSRALPDTAEVDTYIPFEGDY